MECNPLPFDNDHLKSGHCSNQIIGPAHVRAYGIRMAMQLPFENRTQAAEALALRLRDYQGRNPLILAIPRGAVPMGKIIAKRLEGELDVVLVHKLRSPLNREFAIGAIDETGSTYLAPSAKWFLATRAFVEREKTRQLALLKERRARYTPFHRPIDPEGRIAIVVDDGLATGATMIAALRAIRLGNPAELVCAVPVAAPQSLDKVMPLADSVLCLYAPRNFYSVGQFFRNFSPVDDEEVIKTLAEACANPGPVRKA
jgi:putative phosphoribosyl transferase